MKLMHTKEVEHQWPNDRTAGNNTKLGEPKATSLTNAGQDHACKPFTIQLELYT